MFSIPSLTKLARQLTHLGEPKIGQPTGFLCEVCLKAIDSRHNPVSIFKSNGHHHITFESLQLAVDQGCMICCKIDSLIVERPVELPMPDVNLRYYIDGPHDGSGRPLRFSSSTFFHYYRLRFEIYDPDSELVIPGEDDALSVFFVPFSGKYFVYLVRIEPLSVVKKDDGTISSHNSVA